MVTFAGQMLCYPVVYVLDTNVPEDEEERNIISAPGLRDQPLWIVRLILEGIDPKNE